MKDLIKKIAKKLFFTAPKSFQKNHVILDNSQIERLRESLLSNYLDRGETKNKLSEIEFNTAVNGQIYDRLYYNRNRIIPWLNKAKNLKGSKILEIGCGTGISTLALREQGAEVIGIDVDQGALKVAEDRMKLAGFENTEFCLNNADEIQQKFSNQKFDFIIYYAVLEHMTIKERISSLKQAWEMLSTGGLLTVIETPNRLWFHDSHSADMPFFDWLPDELAFQYTKFSNRKIFNEIFKKDLNDKNMLNFLRWGRGASYHEFEIAIAPLKEINVVSSLLRYEKSAFLKCGFKGLRYIKFLKSLNKDLSSGFCYPYLDIILEK